MAVEAIKDSADLEILGGFGEKIVGNASEADKTEDASSRTSNEGAGEAAKQIEQTIQPASTTPETKQTSGETQKTGEKKSNVITDLNTILEGGIIPAAKKVETKKEGEQVTSTPANQDPTQNPNFVDLSEFGEQQQTWLKRMPSDARKYFADLIRVDKSNQEEIKTHKKKIQEISEGKVTIPDSYYEHPEAFKITPAYQEYQQNIGLAQSIYDHWVRQKQLVRAGKDWVDTEDIQDPKTGRTRVMLKNPQAADENTEIYIDENLALARRQIADLENGINALQHEHLGKHKAYSENLRSLEAKYYPQFEDEKYEQRGVLTQLEKDLTTGGIMNKTNPAFGLLSRSLAMNYIYAQYIKNKLTTQQKEVERKVEAAKAGPNSSNFTASGGTTNNNPPKISFKEMDKFFNS